MRRTFLYLLSGLLLELLLFDNAIALYASDTVQNREDSPKSTNESVGFFEHFSLKKHADMTQGDDLVLMTFQRNGTERHPKITLFDLDDFDSPVNLDSKKLAPDGMMQRTPAIELYALTDKTDSRLQSRALLIFQP